MSSLKMNKNIVFLGKSLDGFIAEPNGELDWLEIIPNPEKSDMNYMSLIDEIDAIVMGRNSFETVIGFDIEWPYKKPVFVWSQTLTSIPKRLEGKVKLVSGSVNHILKTLNDLDYYNLYIDGGKIVRSFLEEDQIHELRLTTVPIILGKGIPLFTELGVTLEFEHIKTEIFCEHLVQSHYKRKAAK